MALRIDPDHRRFRDIVRGKIRQNLRKYVTHGEMIHAHAETEWCRASKPL